jgi:hypothetical protein
MRPHPDNVGTPTQSTTRAMTQPPTRPTTRRTPRTSSTATRRNMPTTTTTTSNGTRTGTRTKTAAVFSGGFALAALALALAAPGSARGAPLAGAAEASVDAEATQPASPSRRALVLSAGVRTDLVRSSGLDAFSSSDALAQSSLAVRYLVMPPGHALGLGLGASWDHGTWSSAARGAPTELDTNRLSITLEGRLRLVRRLTAVARVAPGILRRSARLTELSLPNPPFGTASALVAEQVESTASVDGSLGLDLLVAETTRLRAAAVGLWVSADAGYSYSAGRNLVLASGGDAVANRTDDPVRLGQLALRGIFFRFAASVSF